MKKILPVIKIILLLFAISCEQKTDWDIQPSGKFPVADCIITNEMIQHDLRLYWSAGELNQTPEGISGAVVQLSDGTTTLAFTEDPDMQGRYVSDVPFMVSAGKTYRLTLSCEGLSDTAYATMTGVSPLETIDIAASDGNYRVIYHESIPASMTEVFYDWSADVQFCSQYGACTAQEVFYSLDNLDIGKQFPPARQVILFPHQTKIIRRKYSLNEDHQRFIRSMLLETEWCGGFFDTEKGNVPSNFHNGVHGWFAACMVVTDTTFFE